MRLAPVAVLFAALAVSAASCTTTTLVCTSNETQCVWACQTYCYGYGCGTSCGPVCGDVCIEAQYAHVKTLCEPCITSLECAVGGVCIQSAEAPIARCGRACVGEGQGDCPIGFECAGTTNPSAARQCVPLPGACEADGGAPCTADVDCGDAAACRGGRCVARPTAGDAAVDGSDDAAADAGDAAGDASDDGAADADAPADH